MPQTYSGIDGGGEAMRDVGVIRGGSCISVSVVRCGRRQAWRPRTTTIMFPSLCLRRAWVGGRWSVKVRGALSWVCERVKGTLSYDDKWKRYGPGLTGGNCRLFCFDRASLPPGPQAPLTLRMRERHRRRGHSVIQQLLSQRQFPSQVAIVRHGVAPRTHWDECSYEFFARTDGGGVVAEVVVLAILPHRSMASMGCLEALFSDSSTYPLSHRPVLCPVPSRSQDVWKRWLEVPSRLYTRPSPTLPSSPFCRQYYR